MTQQNGPKAPDRSTPVSAGLGGPIEWTSEVRNQSPVQAEWTTVLGALPDLSPEEAVAFYTRASQALPATRVRGFYGAIDGGDEHADDVALFLYREDPRRPVLKLVMSRAEIVRFADALNGLVERFRR